MSGSEAFISTTPFPPDGDDASILNLFEGGFLGLDNIGVFDRSRPLPTGGYLEQSDGTAWMAMFCLNMLRIAIELSQRDPVYEDRRSSSWSIFFTQPGR